MIRIAAIQIAVLIALGSFAFGCHGNDRITAAPNSISGSDVRFKGASSLEKALERIPFTHGKARENLSDLLITPQGLIAVVSDEGTELGVADVAGKGARVFDVLPWLGLDPGAVKEIDLEGIAVQGDRLVVCGSASLKRKKPKPGEDNLKRLSEVEPASGPGSSASDQVLVLRMVGADLDTLTLSPVEHWDVRQKLLEFPVISAFRELPSKDNGLDVEAVAADASHLYFGLRGPVLRGHAVVLKTDWHGNAGQLSFLQLSGLGIRGLSPEPGGRGFCVLAGPTMELDGPVAIYAWDGLTSTFGEREEPGLRWLMSVPSGPALHPEGVFVWRSSLCVLSDGPKLGAASCVSGPAPF